MAHIPKSKAVQAEAVPEDPIQPPAAESNFAGMAEPTAAAASEAKWSPSDLESHLRIEFAKIAFREIVHWQVAERKAGQEDLAADWAFRYADRMVEKSKKKPSLPSYNARGVPGIAEAPTVPEPIAPTADLAPLAEIP